MLVVLMVCNFTKKFFWSLPKVNRICLKNPSIVDIGKCLPEKPRGDGEEEERYK